MPCHLPSSELAQELPAGSVRVTAGESWAGRDWGRVGSDEEDVELIS